MHNFVRCRHQAMADAPKDAGANGSAPVSSEDALKSAVSEYSKSLQASPAARKQVEAAEAVIEKSLERIQVIEQNINAAGSEVDGIAAELVPQLQRHTEQLTNVFALIDKMHDHIHNVKESVSAMESRLEAAEAANASQLTKTFSSLLSAPKPPAPSEPVHIVSVEEFFTSLKV